MKRSLMFLIGYLVCMTFSTCKKSISLKDEYFIFGEYWSECDGDCARVFLMQDGKLYPDDFDVMRANLTFKGSTLSTSKYNHAKILKDNFPDFLVKQPTGVIGDPDGRDQGGIVIEWKTKGNPALRWYIDIDHDTIPQQIWPFIDQVQAVVSSLR